MTSRCPKVTGSKVPGTTTCSILSSLMVSVSPAQNLEGGRTVALLAHLRKPGHVEARRTRVMLVEYTCIAAEKGVRVEVAHEL
jgi:hypothetical protein